MFSLYPFDCARIFIQKLNPNGKVGNPLPIANTRFVKPRREGVGRFMAFILILKSVCRT